MVSQNLVPIALRPAKINPPGDRVAPGRRFSFGYLRVNGVNRRGDDSLPGIEVGGVVVADGLHGRAVDRREDDAGAPDLILRFILEKDADGKALATARP